MPGESLKGGSPGLFCSLDVAESVHAEVCEYRCMH